MKAAGREPVARVGGRLILLDPLDRVLLIHERIQDGTTHWLTPGGGVEGDESPRTAAEREAGEEIGLDVTLPSDAQPVLTTQRLWSWNDVVYDQTDYFFLARVPQAHDPAPRGLTDQEKVTLLGFRWWSGAELRATGEVLVPGDLADVLARVLS
jgi:8-oxo-dGTP pyrophosphatase MutT (NUDIX family)